MTKTMLHTVCFIILGFILLCNACSDLKQEKEASEARNFIVLVDISDRITQKDVINNDMLIIEFLFEKFYSTVKQHLVINSTDKFKFRVIPQKSNDFNTDSFENLLSLEMSAFSIDKKNKILEYRKKELKATIEDFYHLAYKGRNTTDYYGSDIWKYFNEQLNDDLEEHYENTVIVLTDGYFDFENDKHALKQGNLHTSSSFYAGLNGMYWKEKAEKGNYGLIPLKFITDFHCIPCGLNPKNEQLTELEKIQYFWTKWMKMSKINHCTPLSFASSDKMISVLEKQLNTKP